MKDSKDVNRLRSYPRVFFTADTHFGQERTLKLSKRPYDNVEQMDQALIRNWNSIILPTDHVYHLGDFGIYSTVKQLNGHIHLLFGNYERNDCNKSIKSCNDLTNVGTNQFIKYLKALGFYEVLTEDQYAISSPHPEFKTITYVLIHEPSKAIKPLESQPIFNLFGHIHKLQMIKRYGLCVSSDAHHFRPISIKEVEYYHNAINNFYDQNVFE